MILLLFFASAALSGASPGAAAPACPAPDLSAAQAPEQEGPFAYDLRTRAGARLSLALGGLTGELTDDAPLAEQISGAMGIPDAVERLDARTWMISGCRPHSCPEKSLVIYDAACDRLELAALIHYPGRAFRQPAVSIFRLETARYDALEPVALAWARDEVDLEEIRRVAFPGRD